MLSVLICNLESKELSNFVQKKSIAQGMMDLALVSANTNQLRYVMDIGDKHPYFFTSIALILTSLVMQLIVGLGLIYNSRYDSGSVCNIPHSENLSTNKSKH